MTVYTITAEENYDPDTIITFTEDDWAWPFTAQYFVGLSYNKPLRTIVYSTSLTPFVQSQTNDTGHDLWDGQTLLTSGSTYDSHKQRWHYILSKDIDTQVVTRGDTYDPTSIVPAGVQYGFSGTIVHGTGYPTGLYGGVVFSGGSGTLALGSVNVDVFGHVTSVTVLGGPSGYMVGDVLTASNSYLGGAGSGFTYTITSIDFTSGGTERRMTTMINTANNLTLLVDPWSGNAWEHALMQTGAQVCSIYVFPRDKSFGQQISPLFPAHDGAHMELLGFTENYGYVYEQGGAGGSFITGSPRLPTSAEIAADYKLPYFWFASPWSDAGGFYSAAFATTGQAYLYGTPPTAFGVPRNFTLHRLDEPSAAGPLNTATTGGGLTDISTWTTTTGPNTDGALYTTDASDQLFENMVPYYMPGENIVVLITKYFLQDLQGGGGTQTDTFFHATYVTDPDGSPGFEQHSRFVTGFLDANMGPLASTGNTAPAGAAWALIDCQELNLYVNKATYDYSATVDYTKRWFALTVRAVSPGDTFTPPANGTQMRTPNDLNLVVHVEYQFTLGNAPVVTRFYTEDGWDTQLLANSDYTGLITNPNKVASLMSNAYVGDVVDDDIFWDNGLYDEVNNEFWWGAQTDNMWEVSQPFYDRAFHAFQPMPPLLRLGLGAIPPTPVPRVARLRLMYGKTPGTGLPPPSAPSNTLAPVIGAAVVGTPCTTTRGTWTGTAPIVFTYQWYVDGSPVGGATSQSYTPLMGDSGKPIYCLVTATNIAGARSQPSNTVTVSSTTVAPSNTGAPVMNQAFVGSPSTCSTGTWTGTAPITFAYQWRLDGTPIMGATTNAYTPVMGDLTHSLDCLVTATNVAGSASQASNAITVTSSAPTLAIPDRAALLAAFAAWPANGNMTWVCAAGDYGSLGIYNYDFRSAPVVITGQSDPTLVTISDFGTNSSGMTWQNMTVNGTAVSPSIQIDDNTVMPPVLVFKTFRTDSGDAMGTQTARGWDITCPTLVGGSITILGADDATKPDIWGRIDGMVLHGVQLGGGTVTIRDVSYRNFQTNGIIGGGAQNVTIDHCYCSDGFDTPGGHPNAIHFFSNGSIPTTNLTVTNCGIQRGDFGLGFTGIFLEDCVNVFLQNNWVYVDTQSNAFSNSRGSGQTNDNNFCQTFTSTGMGGVMIARGGAVDTVNTNNSVSYLVNNSVSITGPYTSDGVNPGYVPGTDLGSNALVPAASTYGDYTQFNIWKALHHSARDKL